MVSCGKTEGNNVDALLRPDKQNSPRQTCHISASDKKELVQNIIMIEQQRKKACRRSASNILSPVAATRVPLWQQQLCRTSVSTLLFSYRIYPSQYFVLAIYTLSKRAVSKEPGHGWPPNARGEWVGLGLHTGQGWDAWNQCSIEL